MGTVRLRKMEVGDPVTVAWYGGPGTPDRVAGVVYERVGSRWDRWYSVKFDPEVEGHRFGYYRRRHMRRLTGSKSR